MRPLVAASFGALLFLSASAQDQMTVYNATVTTTLETTTVADVQYTGLPAYDPLRLNAPAPPQPPMTSLEIVVPADPVLAGHALSIPQKGNFLGFSIEMSVAESLLGTGPSTLKPIFLNYMANIRNRAGRGPLVRVGGNTQDKSYIVPEGLPDGASVEKIKTSEQVTATPIINYSPDLLYTMANISSLVGAEWFFGLGFNQTDLNSISSNIAVAAEWAHKVLGNNLRGLALGNEPDLYQGHNDRPAPWAVSNYMSEFQTVRDGIMNNATLPTKATLLGPSVCCLVDGFQLEDVLNAGWLEVNLDYLAAVTVQRYPTNNCQINGKVLLPQDIFPDFLRHTGPQLLTAGYLDGARKATSVGKEMIMLEMNTASCGGFPGVSDSFGAAMWITDWALQLAWGNFSAALMHVGGQNVYYNPFTPPPYTKRTTYQWTTGSIYYSTLVVAEAFGRSGAAQVVDLFQNETDMFHPAYLVYEKGRPTRAVVFNYVSDESGASDYVATITPSIATDHVKVRYLRASSVAEQYNITWAGQTLGTSFTSDGRMRGDEQTIQFPCTNGKCAINVPGPSIAVVFFTDEALADSSVPLDATATFATTIIGHRSATIAAGAIITGNGMMPYGIHGTTSHHNGVEERAQLQIGIGLVVIALALAFGIGHGV